MYTLPDTLTQTVSRGKLEPGGPELSHYYDMWGGPSSTFWGPAAAPSVSHLFDSAAPTFGHFPFFCYALLRNLGVWSRGEVHVGWCIELGRRECGVVCGALEEFMSGAL